MDRQKQLLQQQNLAIKYINEHDRNVNTMEFIDFLQENDIEYMFFASIDDMFDYYAEENYNILFYNKVFFTKENCIIILLPF